VGRPTDASVCDVAAFTRNRERLLHGNLCLAVVQAVLADPRAALFAARATARVR